MPDCGDGAANPAPREGTHLRPQARGPEAPDRARVPSPFPSHGETESGRRCAWSLGTRGCRVPPRVPEDQPPGGGSRPAGGLGPPQRGLSTCAPAGSKLSVGVECVSLLKSVWPARQDSQVWHGGGAAGAAELGVCWGFTSPGVCAARCRASAGPGPETQRCREEQVWALERDVSHPTGRRSLALALQVCAGV